MSKPYGRSPRLLGHIPIQRTISGQMVGNFYLEKSTFAPGEPIFLHFQITNNGSKSIKMGRSNPYTFCAGYEIKVSSDRPDPGPHSSCVVGYFGSCLSSLMTIQPGESKTETILLNYEHELVRPGDYEVNAARLISYADAALDDLKAPKETIEARTTLYFHVDPDLSTNPATLQVFVNQLHRQIRWSVWKPLVR